MKQKQSKWLVPLLATLVLTGGLYYALKKTIPVKRAEIDVVNPAYTKPWQAGEGIMLRIFPQTKTTVKVGQEKTFLLVASLPTKTRIANGFRITGLEGRLTFNPSLIKITSIKGWNLPVVLKKPVTKTINKSVAQINFAYGASLSETQKKNFNELPHVMLKNFVGPNLNKAVLEVKYVALKPGPSTAISFPKDKLKVTTNLSTKNEFKGKTNLVLWVRGVSDLVRPPFPKPTPKPIIVVFDLNRDGRVNILDYNLFLRQFGKTGVNQADFNHDRLVDILDYNMLLKAMKSGEVSHHPSYQGGPVKAF